jgi:hypothetical protein
MHQPVTSRADACTYCLHGPMMSQANACTYCMGSGVLSLFRIYLTPATMHKARYTEKWLDAGIVLKGGLKQVHTKVWLGTCRGEKLTDSLKLRVFIEMAQMYPHIATKCSQK